MRLHILCDFFFPFLFCTAVQVREEQPGFPPGLEGEAGGACSQQGGGGSQQQERQRFRCPVPGAARGRSQPAGEQVDPRRPCITPPPPPAPSPGPHGSARRLIFSLKDTRCENHSSPHTHPPERSWIGGFYDGRSTHQNPQNGDNQHFRGVTTN